MPLHLDQRPQTLEEVMGEDNQTTIKALSALLAREREKVPHAFLFTGKSGCGKTTLARIVARELGCADQDFIEMDSAQFRGIDTIRDLRRQAQLHPLAGPCRVWLLDECHQLSRDAQEGLLKLLEDTPAHVWVCLCTTEPEGLKETLKGRCQSFEVRPFGLNEMVRFLKHAAKQTGAHIGADVLKALAKGADGSPRAGLTALEQVLDLPEGDRLTAAEKLGEGVEATVRDLCRSLLDRASWTTLRKVLAGIQKEDPERVRRAVLGYANAVLLKADNTRAAILLEAFEDPTWQMGGWPSITLACYRAHIEANG